MTYPTPSEAELKELLNKTSTSNVRAAYLIEKGCLLPERYNDLKKRIDEYEVRDTDLWICGFPKTGTTWISEISWLILNDFDYEGAKIVDYKRTRMLEFSMLFNVNKEVRFGGEEYEMDSIGHSAKQKDPRTIKSHFPLEILPKQISSGIKKPKIIYTARNAMDTCISYYHHCVNFEDFTGSLEQFCKLFIHGKVNYGPYPEHVLSFWERRNESNVLFVTYEEMQKDLSEVIDRVAKFLNKPVTQEQKTKLQEYVSFSSMKSNPAVNKQEVVKTIEDSGKEVKTPFIRAGKAGGYKKSLAPEIIDEFKFWMGKKFQNAGLNLLN